MQLKPMRAGRVHLYSGKLDERERSLTAVNVIASAREAVLQSVRASGDPHVAVIPEGPYVVPVYRETA
jgi:hypothetical protein